MLRQVLTMMTARQAMSLRALSTLASRVSAPHAASHLIKIPLLPSSRVFRAASSPASYRSFAASAANADLAAALKEELSYEQENFQPKEELKSAPGGYTIEDKPGDGQVILRKTVDSQVIEVAFQVNDQPDPEEYEPEEGEEEGMSVTRHFIITVTKGDKMMTFECETDGDGTNITHVTLEPKDGFDADSTMYTGPVFFELDEKVQNACSQYLAEHYLFDLGPWIFEYIEDKEQRLYMEWLAGCAKFMEK